MLERPSESHDDRGTTGYFSRELRSLLCTLDYHTEPLFVGKKTPLHSKGYKWRCTWSCMRSPEARESVVYAEYTMPLYQELPSRQAFKTLLARP
jgi:hypothetical protein